MTASTIFDSHDVCSSMSTHSLHCILTIYSDYRALGESCQVLARLLFKEHYDHLGDQHDHDQYNGQHEHHDLLLGGRLHSNQLLLHHTEAHNVSVPGPTCVAQHLVEVYSLQSRSVWVIPTILLWVCRVLARLVGATPFGEGFVNQQLFHLCSTSNVGNTILIVCS